MKIINKKYVSKKRVTRYYINDINCKSKKEAYILAFQENIKNFEDLDSFIAENILDHAKEVIKILNEYIGG